MQKWKKLSEVLVYDGYRKIYEKTFEMPNGKTKSFDIGGNGAAVCILAITEGGQVVLTRQFRPGMEEVLLELPGGGLVKDEDPATGAKRELLEETGFQGDLQYINTSYISAYTGHTTISFVATGCKKVQEPEHQNEDGEWIEVEFLSLPDFREHLRAGKLTDVKTGYLGLDFLGLL